MTRTERNRLAAEAVGKRPGTVLPVAPTQPVSRNLALRIPERKIVTGPVRRTSCQPMTRAMRSGDGSGRSLWADSPTLKGETSIIGHDVKWSATVNS